MTTHYEDWADWAGDHPEQAEADLRRDRERAEARAVAEIAARLNLAPSVTTASATPEFEAKMLAIVTPLIESGAIIRRDPNAEIKPFAPYSPKCDTLGHEYDFGICLDCEGVDPNFEPTDEQITTEYLNRTFAA